MSSRSKTHQTARSSRFESRRSSDSSRCGDSQPSSSLSQPPHGSRRISLQISPASRGYPKVTKDGHDDFSTHRENKAFQLRCAHIQWLRESGAFTLNSSAKKWQDTLRYSPSNSARYPFKKDENKDAVRDPEWLPEDYKIHIHYCEMDQTWVTEWLTGILEVHRFDVSTRSDPLGIDCSRVIIVMTPELLDGELPPELLEPIRGKLVLGIMLRECEVPQVLADEITSTIDVTTCDFDDLTYHATFMKEVYKSLKVPTSVCS